MSQRDIRVLSGDAGVRTFDVDDRTTSSASATHKPGEPVKKNGNFALLCANGDPEIGTDIFLGIVEKESTETSTADGKVDVRMVTGGTILRGKATTATNLDTASELQELLNDCVTFDLTGSDFTIDEDETDDPNVHSLCIIGGDTVAGTLDVKVNILATLDGAIVGQTMD